MKLFRSKCFMVAILTFAILLSVPMTAYARDGGGHYIDRDAGGHSMIPGELKEALPNDATYYDYMYISYEMYGKHYVDWFGVAITGNGRVRYRSMEYITNGGTQTETHDYYLYVLSTLPFDFTVAKTQFINGEYNSTGQVAHNSATSRSNLDGKSIYMQSWHLRYGYSGSNAKQISYIPWILKVSLPNLIKVPMSNGSTFDDYNWYLVQSLDFQLDDYGEDTFDPDKDDAVGDYDGGGTGGTGNGDTGNGDTGNGDTGNGDTGNGDTGNGDDDTKPPDFDLDFSNIFTLIYTILKALIDFIISCLNMLVEFADLLLEQTGQFAPLIGSIFTFLPEEFITMMLSGIVIIIIIGIVKK